MRTQLHGILRQPVGIASVIFLVLALVYAVSPVVIYGDGRGTGPTAASIVTDFDLAIDEYQDVEWVGGYQTTVVDGRWYDFFPWTRSIFAVPVAAGLNAAHAVGFGPSASEAVRSDTFEPLLLLPVGVFTSAAASALSALTVMTVLATHQRRLLAGVLTGLGVGLLTSYWSVMSRGAWQHGPAVLWTSLALYAAVKLDTTDGQRRRWSAILGGAMTAAVLTRPTIAFLGVAIAGWVLWSRRAHLGATAIAAAVVALPITVVNLLTFQSLLMPYYDVGRSTAERPDPIGFGVLAFFFSPSRGVVFFLPLVVLFVGWGIRRRDHGVSRPLQVAIGLGAAALLLFVAASPEGWWAGHTYGPRFALDVIPVCVVLAAPAVGAFASSMHRRNLATVAVMLLAGWSLFVHAQGAVIRETGCWNSVPTDIDIDRARVWDLGDAQFLTGVRSLTRGVSPLEDTCSTPAAGSQAIAPRHLNVEGEDVSPNARKTSAA